MQTSVAHMTQLRLPLPVIMSTRSKIVSRDQSKHIPLQQHYIALCIILPTGDLYHMIVHVRTEHMHIV